MASSSSSTAASFGIGGKGSTDTVTMQVADTTTTDENDEDGEGETVMRITTLGAEAIPYFLGAVVDHNPSSVAEEIEVETSASDEDEGQEKEDANSMDEQQQPQQNRETSEKEGEQEQQQDDIVKYACDLAAVGECEDEQIGMQEEKKNDGDAVACQAEYEEEMTITTTRESSKKCGIVGNNEFTVRIVCGGGGKDGEEASADKHDDDEGRMVQVETKRAAFRRVSCIQWASSAKRIQGGEGGSTEASAIPSTSAALLATMKTSSLSSSPVLLKDEWDGASGNDDGDVMMDVQQNAGMPSISNTSGPTPIQTNFDPVLGGPVSQSQLQGSLTTLLTALQNPVGNTVLPCCCCVHPCCIVLRELFSSCFPLWSANQTQNRQNTCCTPNPHFPRRPPPPGFEDPPETEWITTNVNHIDPSGSLRYKCRNCDGLVEYRSRRQKAFHLNLTRLRFECKKCHRRYLTNKQLLLHSLRHNEKTLVCSFCDKRFLTQSELQNHLNTHTKARPYRCPICFTRFNQTTRYYTHVREFHKKYDCNDCFNSKVCTASSLQRRSQGSPKPSTSSSARLSQ